MAPWEEAHEPAVPVGVVLLVEVWAAEAATAEEEVEARPAESGGGGPSEVEPREWDWEEVPVAPGRMKLLKGRGEVGLVD